MRTRILPLSEGVVSNEMSRAPRPLTLSESASANSSFRVIIGEVVSRPWRSESTSITELPLGRDQSNSFGIKGLKSKALEAAGSGVGIAKLLGTVECKGMESNVGRAQRSTCSPITK
jgi:hypothetical protein